jgi:glucose-6-phosphate isomerase
MPKILKVREKMKEFVEKVHSGSWRGATGEKITDIVNIGIGGSHLGPEMATFALQAYNKSGIRVHYVSNVDGEDIFSTLSKINPASSIFIIASKTFTTLETMKNANTAKEWFQEKFSEKKEDISKHFVALSTNVEECLKFGIPAENMFEFWDWVGGRFSLWSAIGLSTALAIGWDNFEKLLRGAYEMDRHFRSAPFERNIPVIFALITIWYSTYWKFSSNVVIPYSHYLSLFPAFLQQLQMESNGKSVNAKGKKIDYPTGQVIWGEAGTNSQHSFFQLLHQGTEVIPVDFIGFVEPGKKVGDHHLWLMSNMLAQSEALMKGKSMDEVLAELSNSGLSEMEIAEIANHKVFEGNLPSNMLLLDKLTPEALGKLIAIFEHKVFVEGIIWNINSFDQWGVELGKQLANVVFNDLKSGESAEKHDSSTNSIINYLRKRNSEMEKEKVL